MMMNETMMHMIAETPDSLEEHRWAYVARNGGALVRPWRTWPPGRRSVGGLETSMAGILAQVLHEEDGVADELWALARANPQAAVTDGSEEKKRAIIDRAVVRGAERVLWANCHAAVLWVVRQLDPIARELARKHSGDDDLEPTLGSLLEVIPETGSRLSWLGIGDSELIDGDRCPTRYLDLAWASFVDHARSHPDDWLQYWELTVCTCHATSELVDAITVSMIKRAMNERSREKGSDQPDHQAIHHDLAHSQDILRTGLEEVMRRMEEQVECKNWFLPGPLPGSVLTNGGEVAGQHLDRLIACVGNTALLVNARVDENGAVLIDDVEASNPIRHIAGETEWESLRTVASATILPVLREAITRSVSMCDSHACEEPTHVPLTWLPVPMACGESLHELQSSGWIQLGLRVVEAVNGEVDLSSNTSANSRVLASAVYVLGDSSATTMSVVRLPPGQEQTSCFSVQPPRSQIHSWIAESSERVCIQQPHHRWLAFSEGARLKFQRATISNAQGDPQKLFVVDLLDPTGCKMKLSDWILGIKDSAPTEEDANLQLANQDTSLEELRFAHYVQHDRRAYELLPIQEYVTEKGFPQLHRRGQRKTNFFSEDLRLESRLLQELYVKVRDPIWQSQGSLRLDLHNEWSRPFIVTIGEHFLDIAMSSCSSVISSVAKFNLGQADGDYYFEHSWEWDSLLAALPLAHFFRDVPLLAKSRSIVSPQGLHSLPELLWPMPDYYRPTTVVVRELTCVGRSMVFMDKHREYSTEEIRLAQYERRARENGTARWIDEAFEQLDPFELLCWLFIYTIPLRPHDDLTWNEQKMKPRSIRSVLFNLRFHSTSMLNDLCVELVNVEDIQAWVVAVTTHFGLSNTTPKWDNRLNMIAGRLRNELLEWRTKVINLATVERPPSSFPRIVVGSALETWLCDKPLSEDFTQVLKAYLAPLSEDILLNSANRLINPAPFKRHKSSTLSTSLFSIHRTGRGAAAQFKHIIGSRGSFKERLGSRMIPSEISVSTGGRARLLSYIKDIHPIQTPQVYAALEGVVTACVPLLDRVCSSLTQNVPPEPFNLQPAWSLRGRKVQMAVAIDEFDITKRPSRMFEVAPPRVPEPSNVVAVGLFVLTCDHLDAAHLRVVPQHDVDVGDVRGGSIDLIEGRCIGIPGYFQYELSLQRAKGHQAGRLTLVWVYLVDPYAPVLSTMNVPPRQREWIVDAVVPVVGEAYGLPMEIQDMVKTMLC